MYLFCILLFLDIVERGLWELIDLQETAIHIIENESEAIVRREAVNLIKELYVHRKWSYVNK